MKNLCLFNYVENSFQNILILTLLLLLSTTVSAQTTREKKTEYDGFVWYKTHSDRFCGAENQNGSTLIPFSRGYTDVMYSTNHGGFFYVYVGRYYGVCKKNGEEIISPSRGYESVSVQKEYISVGKGGKFGACDPTGKEVVAPIYADVIYSSGKYMYKDASGNFVTVSGSSSGSSYPSSSSSASTTRSTTTTTTTQSQPATSNSEPMIICPVCNGNGKVFVDATFSFFCYACDGKGKVAAAVAAKVAEQQMLRGSSSGSTGSSTRSSSGTRKKDCKACYNTGICQKCLGRGEVINAYTNKWSYCNDCNKNYVNANNPKKKGKCPSCSW